MTPVERPMPNPVASTLSTAKMPIASDRLFGRYESVCVVVSIVILV